MKLIAEQIQDVEYIVEEKDGDKEMKIRGIFMQSDQKNRNGRVYPFEILNKEVKRYKEANGGDNPPTRAAHHNTPDIRSMMGRHRDMVPANLRRFT